MNQEQLDNLFTYHKPFGTQPERYEKIRAAAKAYAQVVNENCPESREKSISITNLQLSVMLANSSIAVNEVEPPAEEAKKEDASAPEKTPDAQMNTTAAPAQAAA